MMKKLFIFLLAGLCGNPDLAAQNDSISPAMKYRTWVMPYKTGKKQVLFELKDASVAVSNSSRLKDYKTGRYAIANVDVKQITGIRYERVWRGRAMLIGGAAGFAAGVIADAIIYHDYNAHDNWDAAIGNFFIAAVIPIATAGIGVLIGEAASGGKKTIPIGGSQTEYDRYKARLNDLALKKDLPLPLTDIDGKIYRTAVYHGKAWMTENLRVTRYRNGDSIPETRDTLAWENARGGARCWYRNDPGHTNKQGLLYNRDAVDDPRGLCPEGWHVASADEWAALITCLEGNAPAAGSKNPLFDREYQFICNGGYREKTGFFSRPPVYAQFWTSTPAGSATARAIFLPNIANRITYPDMERQAGLSVRCVMDR
jgi:uncharacterized protein (TIGR02145 family)